MSTEIKRCYTFSHFMLSPMAKGIQTLHSTVELFNKYIPNASNDECVPVSEKEIEDAYSILWDWSLNHKTVISLNPGVSVDLDELYFLFQDEDNFYPWAEFREDEQSLKGVMTAISIILPEKIYETSAIFKNDNFDFDSEGRIICYDTGKSSQEELELLLGYGKFNGFERYLVKILNTYRMAT